MRTLWPVLRPVLHALDPERAHDLTVRALATLPIPAPTPDDPRLAVDAFGLHFPNPIGLAAGFDKNGTLAHKAGALGFGFVEIGTLTPRPQPGNAKPRVFRLPDHGGLINRYGFNNDGHEAALAKLTGKNKRDARTRRVLGINIGANKDAADRIADYAAGVRTMAGEADYLAVNVSSPNTPDLRNLQQPAALDEVLARVVDARDERIASAGRRPVLLKIAPDLSLNELDDVVRVARRRSIDGLIVSNTTVLRPPAVAADPTSRQSGGLSGRPLFPLSTAMLAHAFLRVEGQFSLVGVGGVDSAAAAMAKIEAGASLVQLYSALVFSGPALIGNLKRGLLHRLADGRTLAASVGSQADSWARSLPSRAA